MEIVAGSTHQHPAHGKVRVETVYQEYSVYDNEANTGSIPGGWYVAFSTGDGGETHIDPVSDFISKVASQ